MRGSGPNIYTAAPSSAKSLWRPLCGSRSIRSWLAPSYWENGWDQSRVSETDAVGLMQVEPASAKDAGPALLGRNVDLGDPYDNADVGVAIFRQDLDVFGTPSKALAA